MKRLILFTLILFVGAACGGGSTQEQATTDQTETAKNTDPEYDAKRGVGQFTNVQLGATLDHAMAERGETVYTGKCAACHRLTDKRLVGPGWKDVTSRRTAEWVMNFTTNTEEMIEKDPAVQAQLELCLVRMPNQNVSGEDARSIYEFMRKNDGVE